MEEEFKEGDVVVVNELAPDCPLRKSRSCGDSEINKRDGECVGLMATIMSAEHSSDKNRPQQYRVSFFPPHGGTCVVGVRGLDDEDIELANFKSMSGGEAIHDTKEYPR